MKSRSMFFAYYWDNMKVDVSKVLLDQPPEILEKSKIIAGKIFSIPESLKINFIKKYVEYQKQSFIIKFLQWREAKLKYDYIESTYDWKAEIERSKSICRVYEKFLFEDLDEFASQLLMNADSSEIEH